MHYPLYMLVFVGISASPFDVQKSMSEATQHMHLCITLWTSLNFSPGTSRNLLAPAGRLDPL